MRYLLVLACVSIGCTASSGDDAQPDTGLPESCPMPASIADTGVLAATQAQLCNVSGSMGKLHWYRLAATLPDSTTSYVQLELYDQVGAFAGTTVHTGTFPVETDPQRCGVCVRGLGGKGDAATQKEYFASAGTVNVTAVGGNGQPIAATLSGVTFVEVDADKAPVAGGCMATLASAALSGAVTQVGGTGGSGGGGGGGGGGSCPQTVGD